MFLFKLVDAYKLLTTPKSSSSISTTTTPLWIPTWCMCQNSTDP